MTIYNTPGSKAVMEQWWDRMAARLDYDWSSRLIPTHQGDTHVLVAGPEDGIPVVVLHGALAGSAHALTQTGDFATRHRVYAVDVIGQSPKSAENRPTFDDDTYARWLVEVLDGLGLDTPVLWGVSWGGCIALWTARYAPERVGALMLLNAGGLVNGSAWAGFTQIILPLGYYWLFPTEANRDWAYSALLTEPDPELWSPFIVEARKHIKLDFNAPPIAPDGSLDQLTAPVLVHAADRDLSFPGAAAIERARTLFPNLKQTHLFEDCCHCPPFNAAWTEPWLVRVDAFLEEHCAHLRPG